MKEGTTTSSPGPDAQRAQGEHDRVGAVGHADDVGRRRGRRASSRLEGGDLGAEDVAARVERLARACACMRRAQRLERRRRVEERDRHREGGHPSGRRAGFRSPGGAAGASLALFRDVLVVASLTDPIVEFAVRRDRRPRPAGDLRPHGRRERVHPDPLGDDVPVRRLQRRARGVLACSPWSPSAPRPTSSAPGSPTRSATTGASTSSRSTAASCTSSPRTCSGPTAGSSATATRRSSSRACCRSCAPSSPSPRAWRGCRSGASRVFTTLGCIPWILMLTLHRARRSGRTGRTGRTSCTTSTTRWRRASCSARCGCSCGGGAGGRAPRRAGRRCHALTSRPRSSGCCTGPVELLPVSSSGHVAAVPWLLGWEVAGWDGERRKELEVALHAGTAAALLIVLRGDVARWCAGSRGAGAPVRCGARPAGARSGWSSSGASSERLGTPGTVAAGLLAGALALARRRPGGRRRGGRARPARSTGCGSGSPRRPRSCPGSRATARRWRRRALRGFSAARRASRSRGRSRCRCCSGRARSRARGWRGAHAGARARRRSLAAAGAAFASTLAARRIADQPAAAAVAVGGWRASPPAASAMAPCARVPPACAARPPQSGR